MAENDIDAALLTSYHNINYHADFLEALDTSAGARLFASWSTQFAHILPGE